MKECKCCNLMHIAMGLHPYLRGLKPHGQKIIWCAGSKCHLQRAKRITLRSHWVTGEHTEGTMWATHCMKAFTKKREARSLWERTDKAKICPLIIPRTTDSDQTGKDKICSGTWDSTAKPLRPGPWDIRYGWSGRAHRESMLDVQWEVTHPPVPVQCDQNHKKAIVLLKPKEKLRKELQKKK